MKQTIILSILLIAIQTLSAQDQQISAFVSSPITINPAATGTFGNSNLRVNAGYDWNSYRGFFAEHVVRISADKSLLKGKLGVGVDVANEFGNDPVHSAGAMLSVAYNTGLFDNTYRLSTGMQGGLMQNSLDWDKLIFTEPLFWNGDSIGFPKDHVMYPDFNLGVMMFRNPGVSTLNPWLGISVNHLFRPDDSFYTEMSTPLPRKFSVYAGADIPLSEHVELTPLALYTYQHEMNDINLGCKAKYKAGSFSFSLGSIFKKPIFDNNSSYDLSILAGVGYAGFEFRIESLLLETQQLRHVNHNMGFMGLCWNLPKGKE